VDLKGLLQMLEGRKVRRLLIEGGSEVIWSFLESDCVDEFKVFVGNLILGGSTAPTPAGGGGVKNLEQAVRLRLEASRILDGGVLLEYRVIRG